MASSSPPPISLFSLHNSQHFIFDNFSSLTFQNKTSSVVINNKFTILTVNGSHNGFAKPGKYVATFQFQHLFAATQHFHNIIKQSKIPALIDNIFKVSDEILLSRFKSEGVLSSNRNFFFLVRYDDVFIDFVLSIIKSKGLSKSVESRSSFRINFSEATTENGTLVSDLNIPVIKSNVREPITESSRFVDCSACASLFHVTVKEFCNWIDSHDKLIHRYSTVESPFLYNYCSLDDKNFIDFCKTISPTLSTKRKIHPPSKHDDNDNGTKFKFHKFLPTPTPEPPDSVSELSSSSSSSEVEDVEEGEILESNKQELSLNEINESNASTSPLIYSQLFCCEPNCKNSAQYSYTNMHKQSEPLCNIHLQTKLKLVTYQPVLTSLTLDFIKITPSK